MFPIKLFLVIGAKELWHFLLFMVDLVVSESFIGKLLLEF